MTKYKQIFNPLSKIGFDKVNQEAQIDAALDENSENAVQNKAVTNAISGKQDVIDDLDTIRAGAALGATALQEHQDISGKQDVIDDLDAIRAGAALGATALQEHQDISGKQDKDNNTDLTTTSKSIVGAINEVAAAASGIGTMVNNQLVVSKRAIVTDKLGDPMNEYTLKCLLNGSTMRVMTLSEIAADEYPDAHRYVWHKTAAQKNRAVNIISISSSQGKGALKLTIYDAVRRRSEEHYVCFKFDTPSRGTFLFSTTCKWPIETRYLINELYSYLIVPDDFVGDITVQLVRANVMSGGNLRIVYPTSESDNTKKWTATLVQETGNKLPVSDGESTEVAFCMADNLYGNPLTASQFITPFGYYQVDIIYDFGAIAIGDRLQDNVVNDTQLHDISKQLNTMQDTDADTIVRLLQTMKPALKCEPKNGLYIRHPDLSKLADYQPQYVLMRLQSRCCRKYVDDAGKKHHYKKKKWCLDLRFNNWSSTADDPDTLTANQNVWNTTAAHHTACDDVKDYNSQWHKIGGRLTHENLLAYFNTDNIKSVYFGIAVRITNPRYAGNDTALYYQGQPRYLYSLPAIIKFIVNTTGKNGYRVL
ncbi:MAG: hypothetical protein ACI392_00185 [Paludibacteraceae bacterium]